MLGLTSSVTLPTGAQKIEIYHSVVKLSLDMLSGMARGVASKTTDALTKIFRGSPDLSPLQLAMNCR